MFDSVNNTAHFEALSGVLNFTDSRRGQDILRLNALICPSIVCYMYAI